MSAEAMARDPAWVRRTDVRLRPDPTRVVRTVFLPGQELLASGESRSSAVLGRVLGLGEAEVDAELAGLAASFTHRHRGLEETWDAHFALIRHRLGASQPSANRRRLIGAYFTQEYAVEATALFNPSMVPHPDQTGLPAGSTRFVMTVRAVGDGHLSSMELRTGVVDVDESVTLDDAPSVGVLPVARPAVYSREAFGHRLDDLGGDRTNADFVLGGLPPTFGRPDLDRALDELHAQRLTRGAAVRTVDRFEWIADCTYQVEFPPGSAIGERVLMPRGPSESRGLEDVRMVRFTGADDEAEYLGTYTAFDGRDVSMQLLRTRDFARFSATPLSGPGARNKGLALFPRQIDGRYVAMSRADRENNSVTMSDDLVRWDEPVTVQRPEHAWELVQLGNCGPPIETDRGWLVLTHGVGPMRTYGIGALLLDLDDPLRVVGRLAAPMLTPAADERSGYVPNVVYSCGAMRHGRTLVLPYGCSDSTARIALVDLESLLEELLP
ncbi:glycoside hydrolase family 130 protein [Cellulomonas sp. 73-92]|uniref:glycoside hydrolase family 130 protein n=1 Tax=Cellulomonas sp. 73-92 TaxID=1895740 RepID=UPI000AD56E77|nr:glycoside hydrolase family 130 protein [Cellulomonas sp. 73-92]